MTYQPAHEPQEVLVQLSQSRIASRSLVTCDHCGGRARWSTNVGLLCCGCTARTRRSAEAALHDLATAYGLVIAEEDCATELLHSLAVCGVITVRPSSNPTCSQLAYHPLPERAVADLTLPDINRQAVAVSRILWACALAVGADLRDWPRDAAYPPEEIEPYAELISWALYTRSRFAWLLRYAAELQDAHQTRDRMVRGRLVPATGEPHRSLDGVLQWWITTIKHPAVRELIPVMAETGCDWPPVRSHPIAAARMAI